MPPGSNGDGPISEKRNKDENVIGKLTSKTEAIDKTIEEINEAVPNIEESYKTLDGTISGIESSIQELLSIYEILTNKINPFVDDGKSAAGGADGTKNVEVKAPKKKPGLQKKAKSPAPKPALKLKPELKGKKSSRIPLKTPLPAAVKRRAAPLQNRVLLKTHRAIILARWSNFLLGRLGFAGTLEALMHYETIGWLDAKTKEVLIKYSRAIKHRVSEKEGHMGIDEHVGSLFYYSKLRGRELNPKMYPQLIEELADLDYIG
ncbi:archaeal flagella protein [archaeon BMS3Bbin16]|nr:archaeal flagella protein [archaeon BMS3Bbin16]